MVFTGKARPRGYENRRCEIVSRKGTPPGIVKVRFEKGGTVYSVDARNLKRA
jgi:hypothetical protein